MFGPLAALALLFAQVNNAPAPQATPNPLVQYLPLLPIPIVFYFLLIRPQQQQERKRKELVNSLAKGERVLTAAGIFGTVVSVDPKTGRVVLRLDDDGKVKVTFTKGSIIRVFRDGVDPGPDPV